jgi:ribosomal protein L37AE/L43A
METMVIIMVKQIDIIKVPCPACGKTTLKREGAPFNGLECTSCNTGMTYAYAVRMGLVEEVVKGDRKTAVQAHKTRMKLQKKGKKEETTN